MIYYIDSFHLYLKPIDEQRQQTGKLVLQKASQIWLGGSCYSIGGPKVVPTGGPGGPFMALFMVQLDHLPCGSFTYTA